MMNNPIGFKRLLSVSQGFFLGEKNSTWLEPSSISIDSRACKVNSLFIPLKGERTDGHNHIEQALAKGASAVLVDKSWASKNKQCIKALLKSYPVLFFPVDNTLQKLQYLAKKHLKDFPDLKVIGITGSNGKTTTKEMVAAVLSSCATCFKSRGNFNSEIGLPLMVLEIDKAYDYAVLEMGINHVGEMAILSDIAQPSVGIITNIGRAHIGFLGSQRGIAEEKRKIFSSMDNQGVALVFEGDPYKDFLLENVKGRSITFGPRSQSDFLGVESLGFYGQKLLFKDLQINLPLVGEYNLQNAFAAIGLAKVFDIPLNRVKQGLESLEYSFGRNELIKGEYNILQDCYNANPDSMEASINMFDSLKLEGQKFAVLGDMLELGQQSEALHSHIGKLLSSKSFDYVFFIGKQMKLAYNTLCSYHGKCSYFESMDSLIQELKTMILPQDNILLKGSRSMELERITKKIINQEVDLC